MVSATGPADLSYPLRYAPDAGKRRLMAVMGGLVIAFGLFGFVLGVGLAAGVVPPDKNGARPAPVLIVCGASLAAFGVYSVRYLWRTALTLYQDRLEYRGGLRTVVLRRTEIAGRSAFREREYATSFKIRPLSAGRLNVAIDLYAPRDDAFEAWFADIPVTGSRPAGPEPRDS